jgi:hypothetical protein
MWRPKTLGPIVCERQLILHAAKKRYTVRVSIGRPRRAPKAGVGDPWWCPIEIAARRRRTLTCIAGEDSLQAVVLALRIAETKLTLLSREHCDKLSCFGESPTSLFGSPTLMWHVEDSLNRLVAGLKEARSAIDELMRTESKPVTGRRAASMRHVLRRIDALISSGGAADAP